VRIAPNTVSAPSRWESTAHVASVTARLAIAGHRTDGSPQPRAPVDARRFRQFHRLHLVRGQERYPIFDRRFARALPASEQTIWVEPTRISYPSITVRRQRIWRAPRSGNFRTRSMRWINGEVLRRFHAGSQYLTFHRHDPRPSADFGLRPRRKWGSEPTRRCD